MLRGRGLGAGVLGFGMLRSGRLRSRLGLWCWRSGGGFVLWGGSALLRFGGTGEAPVATWVVATWLIATRFRFRLDGLVFLEHEGGVFLVAFGGEADIVEL